MPTAFHPLLLLLLLLLARLVSFFFFFFFFLLPGGSKGDATMVPRHNIHRSSAAICIKARAHIAPIK